MKTPLLVNGASTGTSIPGYVIEAQYACKHGYLIITSYDCPFEEANTFVLLSSSYKMLAKTQLGRWYDSLLLHAHWPLGDSALRLHYYGHQFYTLNIDERHLHIFKRPSLRLEIDTLPPFDERSQQSIQELDAKLEATRSTLEEDRANSDK